MQQKIPFLTGSRVCAQFGLFRVEALSEEYQNAKDCFCNAATPFRRILPFAFVAVVPAKVWIMCHISIPGFSGISQVKVHQQI